jgi:hypothetical protein
MSIRFLFAAICISAALGLSGVAYAHSTGASFEQKNGAYVIDVGYDVSSFKAGEAVRFDFLLHDAADEKDLDFNHVWVRMVNTSEKQTELATGIAHQSIGPTTLLYVFPSGGTYTLEPSFRDAAGEDIATTSITISVAPAEDAGFSTASIVGALLAAFAGMFVGYLLRK